MNSHKTIYNAEVRTMTMYACFFITFLCIVFSGVIFSINTQLGLITLLIAFLSNGAAFTIALIKAILKEKV